MRSYIYLTSEQIPEHVLRAKYSKNRLSMRDIAKEFSCSKTYIRSLLLKYKIPLRAPNKFHKTNHKVFGKRRVNGVTVDNKAELRAVEAITRLYYDGITPTAIARSLDTLKIPTKRQGKGWHHHTVIAILKREKIYKSKRQPRSK